MNEILKFLIGALSLSVLVVVFVFISNLITKEQAAQRQQRAEQKKTQAIRNYAAAVQRREQAKHNRAIKNYQAHQRVIQRQQRKLLWKRRQRQFLEITKRVLYNAFPEMRDPQLRGQFIRQLIGQAVQQIIGGGYLSEQWKRDIRNNLRDAEGNFQLKRKLSTWFVSQKQEIEQQYQRQEITDEEHQYHLDHLEQIYNEILQNIDLQG